MKKRIVIVVGIIVLLLAGILAGGSWYMVDYSLRPENRGKDMQGSLTFMRESILTSFRGWTASKVIRHCATLLSLLPTAYACTLFM